MSECSLLQPLAAPSPSPCASGKKTLRFSVNYVPDAFDDAAGLLSAVDAMGLEGIVSKRIDAPYRSGTRCGWVKVKTEAWRLIGQERQRLFGWTRGR